VLFPTHSCRFAVHSWAANLHPGKTSSPSMACCVAAHSCTTCSNQQSRPHALPRILCLPILGHHHSLALFAPSVLQTGSGATHFCASFPVPGTLQQYGPSLCNSNTLDLDLPFCLLLGQNSYPSLHLAYHSRTCFHHHHHVYYSVMSSSSARQPGNSPCLTGNCCLDHPLFCHISYYPLLQGTRTLGTCA
jgi:hypothetical protein